MSNPRDVNLDIVGHDKTERATKSAERNLDGLSRKMEATSRSGGGLSAAMGKMRLSTELAVRALTSGPGLAGAMLLLIKLSQVSAGALVFGLGAALTTLGVVAAAQNRNVKASFTDMVDHVKKSIQGLALPFVPVLMHIAQLARSTFDAFAPALGQSFIRLAPVLDRFAGRVATGLGRLKPSIAPITTAFSLLLDAIGARLPSALSGLNRSIIQMSNVVAAQPQVFADFAIGAVQAISAVTKTFAFLSFVAGNWEQVIRDTDQGTRKFWNDWDALSVAATQSTLGFNGSVFALGGAAEKTREQLDEMANALLRQRADARGFQAAIDDATAALKKNGRTLDIHSQKGRNNQEALDKIAESTLRWRDASDKAGGGLARSNAILGQGRAQLIRTATQFGLTGAQARAYADKVLGIPKNWTTKIKLDAAAANETLRETRRLLAGITSKTISVTTVRRQVGSGGGAGGAIPLGGGATFEATAPGGAYRTQAPLQPSFNVDSRVYLDGQLISATARALVTDSATRQAWRASTGRR